MIRHFQSILFVIAFAAIVAVAGCEPKEGGPTESPEIHTPIFEQPIPAGTELVTDGSVKLNVQHRRVTNGSQEKLEFTITEEHGYAVDGTHLAFWYRSKNDKGEWVDDPKEIGFFVKDRLGFNDTLTVSTALIPLEFEHLGIDLGATTDENWGVRVKDPGRVMKKVE